MAEQTAGLADGCRGFPGSGQARKGQKGRHAKKSAGQEAGPKEPSPHLVLEVEGTPVNKSTTPIWPLPIIDAPIKHSACHQPQDPEACPAGSANTSGLSTPPQQTQDPVLAPHNFFLQADSTPQDC